MDAFITQTLHQFQAQSVLELVAVLLALAYVWLAARGNIWCWPCALISTGIYVGIFWQVTLPFHAGLNIYYLLMAVYGWYQWKQQADSSFTCIRWSKLRHICWIAILTVIAQLLILLVGEQLDNQHLQLDAFITVFSVYTTVLVAHRVLENWLYWIVIDVFAAYLYFSKELYLTAGLFALYTLFAVYGYVNWQRQQQRSRASVNQAQGAI